MGPPCKPNHFGDGNLKFNRRKPYSVSGRNVRQIPLCFEESDCTSRGTGRRCSNFLIGEKQRPLTNGSTGVFCRSPMLRLDTISRQNRLSMHIFNVENWGGA